MIKILQCDDIVKPRFITKCDLKNDRKLEGTALIMVLDVIVSVSLVPSLASCQLLRLFVEYLSHGERSSTAVPQQSNKRLLL